MDKNMYMSIDEVVSLSEIQNIAISEDGQNVAYVKTTTDWKDDAYRNHIWIYENESKRHYPISVEKNESDRPAWCPKNNLLAYIADTEEKGKKTKQIFLKSYDELNGVQITNSKESVSRFKWSPDGKGVYFLASESESEEIKNRKEIYGDFEFIDKEYRNTCLYYMELDKAFQNSIENKPKTISKDSKEEKKEDIIQLTNPKDFNIRSFDISPDGKKVVLVCTPTSKIDDGDTSMYILDINTKEIEKLETREFLSSSLAFSPDGKKIAFSKTPFEKEYYKWRIEEDMSVAIYDVETKQVISNISKIDSNVTIIKWSSQGILIEWQDKANYRIGIMSEEGNIDTISNENICFVAAAAITSDGKNIAYVKVTENKMLEVYLNDMKITNESKVYENKSLSHKERINWTSSDGLQIEGILSTPKDYDNTKKYPLLVIVHGGPTWASFPIHNMSRVYPIEQFIERGFIVLEPNYRGSSGYGSKFRTANHRMLGVGDYDDVISGVDMLIEKGIVDGEKVGIMGWSQGGYISAFCATYSNRFKAISVGAGISNWVTYYTNTDITTFTRMFLGDTPWNDLEIYRKTSPMTYIKSACTPTLIQHGEKDARVPTPNAFELYRGLQDLGIESELVIFKGMGHGPNKPGFHRAIMEQNLEWFTKHIK